MDYIVTYEELIGGKFVEKEETVYIANFESEEQLIRNAKEYLTQILCYSQNIIILDVISVVNSEVDLDSFEG